MKIYVSHLRKGDYRIELYKPLSDSGIAEFIFPHENSDEPFDSKNLFSNKGCDLILAEVSSPSTGQGIELGWANVLGIRIVCLYKQGSKISGSLKFLTDKFIEYSDSRDLTNKLSIIL